MIDLSVSGRPKLRTSDGCMLPQPTKRLVQRAVTAQYRLWDVTKSIAAVGVWSVETNED